MVKSVPLLSDCSGNHPADIVFLLDSSGSVGELNFQKLKEFVAQFAQSVEIGNGPNEVQIGAVTWSSSVYNQFNLNTFSTKTALLNAIDGISYNSGSTKTHLALDYVRVNSFQPSVGDRANVPNILVVITGDESDSSSQTATAAQALHAIPGLTIFAIGVRGGVTGELGIIASDLRKVLVANDFSTLQVLQTMIQRQICAANSGMLI